MVKKKDFSQDPFEEFGGYADDVSEGLSDDPFAEFGGYADDQPLQQPQESDLAQELPEETKNAIINTVLTYSKPILKGIVGIADIPVAVGNLLVAGMNAQTNKFQEEGAATPNLNIPYGKYPSDMVGEAIDSYTDGESKFTDNNPIFKGAEYATSMATGGGAAGALAKTGSKMLQKAAPYLGSTNKYDAMIAGGMGATGQAVENMTDNKLAGAGAELAVGVGAPKRFASLKEMAGVRAPKANTFTEQKGALNEDVIDAAERLKVDAPLSYVTDNTLASHMTKVTDKMPLGLGDKLKNNVKDAENSILEAKNRLAKNIGPERDQEQINALYDEAKAHLKKSTKTTEWDVNYSDKAKATVQEKEQIPFNGADNRIENQTNKIGYDKNKIGYDDVEVIRGKKQGAKAEQQSGQDKQRTYEYKETEQKVNDKIRANETLKTFEKIKNNIDKSLIPKEGASLLKRDIERWEKRFAKNSVNDQQYIESLHDAKVALNEKINWNAKNPATMTEREKSMRFVNNELKDIRAAIVRDLEKYGEQNPEYLAALKKADAHYKTVADREQFDKIFDESKIGNVDIGGKFHAIVREANKPKNREKLDAILSNPENKQMLEDIVLLSSRAQASKNKLGETPTAEKVAVFKMFGGMLAVFADFKSAMKSATATVGTVFTAKFVSDKEALKRAYSFALNPTSEEAKKFNNRFKSRYGLGVRDIAKGFEESEQRNNEEV
ncbi:MULTISPECIES: hypothetical protein [Cysteiniphilum]|uniref:hypothetical protein n=1 Tax=Cysteiniphilum TaxID=2056696 RepID=UPI00178714B6|nr:MULTISPECIES: hypothetical protein [Cysteiniphilum]